MSEYNEDDLIEAVKGEEVHRGRVKARGAGIQGLGENGFALHYYLREGFTLTVIEKAAPKPPKEPGYYFDKDGDPWRLRDTDRVGLVARFAPFTRLEPVPVTAKKVLDEVAHLLEGRPNDRRTGDDILRELRQTFGVTP